MGFEDAKFRGAQNPKQGRKPLQTARTHSRCGEAPGRAQEPGTATTRTTAGEGLGALLIQTVLARGPEFAKKLCLLQNQNAAVK